MDAHDMQSINTLKHLGVFCARFNKAVPEAGSEPKGEWNGDKNKLNFITKIKWGEMINDIKMKNNYL